VPAGGGRPPSYDDGPWLTDLGGGSGRLDHHPRGLHHPAGLGPAHCRTLPLPGLGHTTTPGTVPCRRCRRVHLHSPHQLNPLMPRLSPVDLAWPGGVTSTPPPGHDLTPYGSWSWCLVLRHHGSPLLRSLTKQLRAFQRHSYHSGGLAAFIASLLFPWRSPWRTRWRSCFSSYEAPGSDWPRCSARSCHRAPPVRAPWPLQPWLTPRRGV
jgi:hypothetical protein